MPAGEAKDAARSGCLSLVYCRRQNEWHTPTCSHWLKVKLPWAWHQLETFVPLVMSGTTCTAKAAILSFVEQLLPRSHCQARSVSGRNMGPLTISDPPLRLPPPPPSSATCHNHASLSTIDPLPFLPTRIHSATSQPQTYGTCMHTSKQTQPPPPPPQNTHPHPAPLPTHTQMSCQLPHMQHWLIHHTQSIYSTYTFTVWNISHEHFRFLRVCTNI